MNTESISKMDKLILMNTLGFKARYSMEDIDSILKKTIKDYSIDYTTGEVVITLIKPAKYATISVDLEI